MSVVNRMLQDIDRRRDGAADAAQGVFDGTESVEPRRPMTSSQGPKISSVWARWLAAVVVIAFAVWRFWPAAEVSDRAVAPSASSDSSASQARAPAETVSPAAAPTISSPGTASPGVSGASVSPVTSTAISALVPSASLHVDPTSAASAVPPASGSKHRVVASAETLKLSMKLSQLNAEAALITAPITAPSAAPAVKVPPSAASTQTATASSAPAGGLAPPVARDVVTITNVAPRTVAAEDTIRSARAFWADGAKSAAMTTLRDSLSVAEAARNAAAAALLAREIARLDIAENRSQTALDLLKRLESLVGDDADVWALRGNAEQRLGMHAEAAESYLAALRLRPTEAKWMLGAAISMAANGKPDEARVWAERAAERGAVSPTIANYLRQLGVTLR